MPAVDIITLAQAKAQLNINSTTFDTQLASVLSAASRMWVKRCGPVKDEGAIDEWVDGGNPRIMVRNSPILTVNVVEEVIGALTHPLTLQTLQPGGDTSAWGYSVDLSTGMLTRRAAAIAIPFAAGVKNIHINYNAGYASTPEDITFAVTLLTQHLWETTRGGGRRPGQQTDDQWSPQYAFAWPHRVEEIAASYELPGIA